MYYYSFNIGDYRKDTVHLSRLEHSIYRDLIDWYYLDESPIPLETQSVSRRLRLATEEEQNALIAVLQDFFSQSEDGWRHKRIDEDIEKYRNQCATNRINGGNGGRPKKEKNPVGYESEPSRNPNQEPITINQEPVTNNQEPDLKHKVSKDTLSGSIPTCPHQDIVSLFHEVLPELPEVRIWNPTRQGYLKARWRETALEEKWETQEQGIAWFKKFFAWIRHSKFLMGKVPPNRGGRPFECELEWILKPNNWTKILEGKYHAS